MEIITDGLAMKTWNLGLANAIFLKDLHKGFKWIRSTAETTWTPETIWNHLEPRIIQGFHGFAVATILRKYYFGGSWPPDHPQNNLACMKMRQDRDRLALKTWSLGFASNSTRQLIFLKDLHKGFKWIHARAEWIWKPGNIWNDLEPRITQAFRGFAVARILRSYYFGGPPGNLAWTKIRQDWSRAALKTW